METVSEEKSKKQPGGQEYLYALIRCADWVPNAYKQLADKNRSDLEFLKELYLCACDGLPVEKAQGAQGKKTPEKVLHALRKKYLEESFTEGYEEELKGVRKKAAVLERDVSQMKQAVNDIVERMPTFESAFPEPETESRKEKVLQKGTEEKQPVSADKQQETGNSQENVPKSGTKKTVWHYSMKIPWHLKSKNTRSYIEHLLTEGYNNEQLMYLLDCLEEGMKPKEIERIASPKLPVYVMKRLREMEDRKSTRKDG